MRGLDPRIHPSSQDSSKEMDCRVKPGNDGGALDLPQAQLILPGQRVMTRLVNNCMTKRRDPHV
jgi:hypothetical protein